MTLFAMSDQFWNGFWASIGPLLAIIVTAIMNRVKLNAVATNVQKIEVATNSMKDALVLATKNAGELKGASDERARADAKADVKAADAMSVRDPSGKEIATIEPVELEAAQRRPSLFSGEGLHPRKVSD